MSELLNRVGAKWNQFARKEIKPQEMLDSDAELEIADEKLLAEAKALGSLSRSPAWHLLADRRAARINWLHIKLERELDPMKVADYRGEIKGLRIDNKYIEDILRQAGDPM